MRYALLLLVLSLPAMAHELPGIPAENQAWYQNAETNPEARPTFPSPWIKCCNHAEVIPVKDIIFPTQDHGWRWNDKGTIKNIPNIIIHWHESAPDNRPTLFVYLGVMTCFYPPQGGCVMFCENPRCMRAAQDRKKFLDPRRGQGDDLAYTSKYFCSPECEEAIVDDLERQAQYARLVN